MLEMSAARTLTLTMLEMSAARTRMGTRCLTSSTIVRKLRIPDSRIAMGTEWETLVTTAERCQILVKKTQTTTLLATSVTPSMTGTTMASLMRLTTARTSQTRTNSTASLVLKMGSAMPVTMTMTTMAFLMLTTTASWFQILINLTPTEMGKETLVRTTATKIEWRTRTIFVRAIQLSPSLISVVWCH